MAPIRSLFVLAVLIPILFVIHYSAPLFFKFDPAVLQATCKAAIAKHGGNTKPLLQQIAADLAVEYPGIVDPYDDKKWVFNVAGGATGQMMILHASLTEYLIFFGSASGTEGHSGAHWADDYFTILTGQQTAAFLGELEPRRYNPGDQHYHPMFTAAHYTVANSTWSLELAQGKRYFKTTCLHLNPNFRLILKPNEFTPSSVAQIDRPVSMSSIDKSFDSAYPSGMSSDPASQPKPSLRQDLPPNNDSLLAKADEPHNTSNPVKRSAGAAGESQAAPSSADNATSESGEKKGLGEKIKDKLGM